MKKLLACAAALALSASGLVAGAASAGADSHHSHSSVSVVGNGSHVTLSRSSVDAGVVRFRVSSTFAGGSSNITMFQPKAHVNVARVLADLQEEFSSDPATAAKGTRDLVRDARFFGLADVGPGTPAVVTERLARGTYYLMDLGAPPTGAPALTTLRVRGDGDRDEHGDHGDHLSLPRARATVEVTSADRFVVHGRLPAHGTVRVHNVSDTIHFMDISPVKKGTTDAQIQAFFDSNSQQPPSFFVDGPSVGMDVQSPGRQAFLTYRLPPGTYVLLCFVADDETGMPHALMGMHKVVTLK
ncbi:hypothetical protein [Terrabacter sp. 2RAF25]|uniref:hypothetical protein n=1 Tax=Terrabacter sp. 2RAF25 TaxID=3232998 RepID=UPI003F9A6DB2